VVEKIGDGTKAVVKVPVRVTKDAAIGIRDAGGSVVNHVKNAF
jgi:hypothetical protein